MEDSNDKVIDIRAQVEARRQEETEHIPPAVEEKSSGSGGPDDPRFILDCLGGNERGDGVLFAALHRDRFVFEKATRRWLEYPPDGHHWQIDKMGRSSAAVEKVALKYQERAVSLASEIRELREQLDTAEDRSEVARKAEDREGQRLAQLDAARLASDVERYSNKRKTLNKRVDRLRSVRGVANCLQMAHSIDQPLAILEEQIDTSPMLLPCGNGVIDLETGILRQGHPSDWLVKASPTNLPDGIDQYLATGNNCPCPDWDHTIKDIFGDEEVSDYFHRLLGYSITGLSTEHIVTVAIGEGRNGKGTTFELLQRILGDFAWVISPELILEQKNARSSSGAAADLVSLDGRRLIIGSETDENRKISGSAVKQLTGGDTIKARPLYQAEEINIAQTWKLFLHTNHIPRGLTKDFALLQRLVYIKFPFLYVDDPVAEARIKPALADQFRVKDRALPGRLAKEAEGILAWLVRGCLLYQKQGLQPPDKLKADVDELRQDEDLLGQFLEARCERCPDDPYAHVLLKQFYSVFEEWHKENHGDYVPSRKRVATDLAARGYRKDKKGGNICIYGLRMLPQLSEF